MTIEELKKFFKSFDFKGVQFVSIKGYRNSKGEVANHLVNVGYSYANAKNADLEVIKSVDIDKLSVAINFDRNLVEAAKLELEKSLIAPDFNRSQGQTNAFVKLNEKGTIQFCTNTAEISIAALGVKKEVLVKGEYKEVKSAEKTLCKNAIKKALDFRTNKIKRFNLSNIKSVSVNGNTIEIEP